MIRETGRIVHWIEPATTELLGLETNNWVDAFTCVWIDILKHQWLRLLDVLVLAHIGVAGAIALVQVGLHVRRDLRVFEQFLIPLFYATSKNLKTYVIDVSIV